MVFAGWRWADVNISVKENTIKEVKEETGLQVTADRIIAVRDRNKHNSPVYAYGVCKIFVLCSVLDGNFKDNIETIGIDYFDEENLPELSVEKIRKTRSVCASAPMRKKIGSLCLIDRGKQGKLHPCLRETKIFLPEQNIGQVPQDTAFQAEGGPFL